LTCIPEKDFVLTCIPEKDFCFDLHSGEDSEAVADEDIQNHVVPPALVEVWQQMPKRNLP
jgi:hypothetical protein